MSPPFPEIGSTIVGRDKKYFCLGRLGKGTFCSIHKCVDLSYSHSQTNVAQRIVAAKAELANFVDSGVIDGEAAILKFLYAALPEGMVPTFVDYVRPTGSEAEANCDETAGVSAIIMEYLPGEDMHLLRDRHCQAHATGSTPGTSGSTVTRGVSVKDAVYLVADVMLPLLKAMHQVGIVHRDVKPSNMVRTGTTASDRKFKVVDFGLSKSFIVPKDSPFADTNRPWKGLWMSPSFTSASINHHSNNVRLSTLEKLPEDMVRGGCIRLERDCADFRGTSMYASLRVHQGKDHCPRDDVWGLLYVFCDLVSGGLPWMSHAAARDRTSCQIIKEMVLGERGREDWDGMNRGDENAAGGLGNRSPNPELVPKNGEDATEWLLYGAAYHLAKYKRDHLERSQGSDSVTIELPEPLSLSKNEHFVSCLRKAFRHVASLRFVEMPDYDLIDECLRGFLHDSSSSNGSLDIPVFPIDWNERRSLKKRRTLSSNKVAPIDTGGVSWDLLDTDDTDPLTNTVLVEAENDRRAALEAAAAALDDASRITGGAAASSMGVNITPAANIVASNLDMSGSLSGEAGDLARLPLQLQFHLSQVEYNAQHPTTIKKYLALRDWMALALPLAYGVWDTASWERGNHRTESDGYRNEVYMSLLQKCLNAAEPFNGFADRDCFYYPDSCERIRKRRRVRTVSIPHLIPEDPRSNDDPTDSESPLLVVSRVFFALRLALDLERGKNFSPPPKLSFGFGWPGMTIAALN